MGRCFVRLTKTLAYRIFGPGPLHGSACMLPRGVSLGGRGDCLSRVVVNPASFRDGIRYHHFPGVSDEQRTPSRATFHGAKRPSRTGRASPVGICGVVLLLLPSSSAPLSAEVGSYTKTEMSRSLISTPMSTWFVLPIPRPRRVNWLRVAYFSATSCQW